MLRVWYGQFCQFKFVALTIVALPLAQDAMGQAELRLDMSETTAVQASACAATQRCELALPQMRPQPRPSHLAPRRGYGWGLAGGPTESFAPVAPAVGTVAPHAPSPALPATGRLRP